MSTAGSRVYGGRSAEERRVERRRKLLDAGLELIGTKGFSATTVRGVCDRAGLSARFFYESFEDLDALAAAVFDEIIEDVLAKTVSALGEHPDEEVEAKLRAGVTILVTEMVEDPRRARIAFVEGLGSEPLMKRRMAGMRTIAAMFAAEIRSAYTVPADDPFVDLTSVALSGAVIELMIVWIDGELRIPREQLIDDVVQLMMINAEGAAAVANRRGRRSRRS